MSQNWIEIWGIQPIAETNTTFFTWQQLFFRIDFEKTKMSFECFPSIKIGYGWNVIMLYIFNSVPCSNYNPITFSVDETCLRRFPSLYSHSCQHFLNIMFVRRNRHISFVYFTCPYGINEWMTHRYLYIMWLMRSHIYIIFSFGELAKHFYFRGNFEEFRNNPSTHTHTPPLTLALCSKIKLTNNWIEISSVMMFRICLLLILQ